MLPPGAFSAGAKGRFRSGVDDHGDAECAASTGGRRGKACRHHFNRRFGTTVIGMAGRGRYTRGRCNRGAPQDPFLARAKSREATCRIRRCARLKQEQSQCHSPIRARRPWHAESLPSNGSGVHKRNPPHWEFAESRWLRRALIGVRWKRYRLRLRRGIAAVGRRSDHRARRDSRRSRTVAGTRLWDHPSVAMSCT